MDQITAVSTSPFGVTVGPGGRGKGTQRPVPVPTGYYDLWVADNPHLALEYMVLTIAAKLHGLTIADNLRWQYGIPDDYCLNPGARRAEGLVPDKSLVDMLCMLE
jgi:hypothetical protein